MATVKASVAAPAAVVILIAGIFLGRATVREGGRTDGEETSALSAAALAADPVDSRLASTQQSSRQLAEVPTPPVLPPSEEVKSVSTPEIARSAEAPADLEKKYAGKELGDLMVALQEVMATHGVERKRLIDERWELGLYDQQFVPDGAPNLPAPRAPDGSFPSYGFRTEPTAGGTIVKTSVLWPEEYPEFAALERELKWLRARTGGFPPPLAGK